MQQEKQKKISEQINNFVCCRFGLSEEELKSKPRFEKTSICRFIACTLMKEFTDMRDYEIAGIFGKNRTLVSYARKKVRGILDIELYEYEDILVLKKQVAEIANQ